ncbi:MAG: hypothetical protein WC891_08905 [Actinomycetota bacterium]
MPDYRLYTDEELGPYANPYPTMEQDNMGRYKNPLEILRQLASQTMPYGGFDPESDTFSDAQSVYRDMITNARTPTRWNSLNQTWQRGGGPLNTRANYGPNPWEMESFKTAFENMQKQSEVQYRRRRDKQNAADAASWQIPKGQPGYRQGPTSVSGGFPEVGYSPFFHRVGMPSGAPEEAQYRFDRPFGKPNPLTTNYMEQGPEGQEAIPSVSDTIEPSYRTASTTPGRPLQLTGPNAEKFQVPSFWRNMEDKANKPDADLQRQTMQDYLNARMGGIRDEVHNRVGGSDFESNKRKAAVEANAESQLEQLRQTLAQIHGVQYPYQTPKERAADKEAVIKDPQLTQDIKTALGNILDPSGRKDAEGNVLKKYGPKPIAQMARMWAQDVNSLPPEVLADLPEKFRQQYRTPRPALPPMNPQTEQNAPAPAPTSAAQPTKGEQAMDIAKGIGNMARPFMPPGIEWMKRGIEAAAPYIPGPSEDLKQAGRNLAQLPSDLRNKVWPLILKLYMQQYGLGGK